MGCVSSGAEQVLSLVGGREEDVGGGVEEVLMIPS